MDLSWNMPELPQDLSLIYPLTLSTRFPSFVPSTLNYMISEHINQEWKGNL